MSDIIFRKNKLKYLFFILVLFSIIFFVLFFSILFLTNPYKYISGFFRNEFIIYLTSILGIISSAILLYITIKSIFNREFFIRINEKNLFIGIAQYSNKSINWHDIMKIEVISINNIDHIIIHIKNIEYYKSKETGIQKYFFMSRVKKYGTPFVINTNALSEKVGGIAEVMIQNWEKFK